MSGLGVQKISLVSESPQLNFQLLLTLQDEIIDMKLTCEQQMLFFGLKVDKQYIQNNTDMVMLFPSVKCLYSTMLRLEEEFEVFIDGKIVMSIDLAAAKIDLKKQYTFQLKKSPSAQLQWLKMRIKQQRKYRQQQQRKAEEKLQQLQSIITQKQKKIQQTNHEMKNLQIQLGKTANKMLIFQQQIERLQSQLSQSKQSNKKHQKYKEQLEQSLADQVSRSKQAETQLSVCQYQKQRIITSICIFNPHSQHFITKYQAQTIQVIKKCENGWSNFVSGWQIPQKQITTFRFRQIKTRDGSLGIGIGSQAVFSSLNIEHVQYIAYFCRDGRIYENGLKRVNGNPFVPDKEFTVQINRIEGKIDWICDKAIMGSASIPPSLSSKPLFLILKIFWKQDEFQLYY